VRSGVSGISRGEKVLSL